jgi:hypothetical protein
MAITPKLEWWFDTDVQDVHRPALLDLAQKISSLKSYPAGYRIRFERIKGGGSGAVVYDVAFLDTAQKIVDHLVFKFHHDPDDARSESNRSQKVQGKDFFAQLGQTYFPEFPNWVVYAHAAGEDNSETLGELLIRDNPDVAVLTHVFDTFFSGVHNQLRSRDDGHLKEGLEYLASYRPRLMPDLIIEAKTALFNPTESRLTVPYSKHSPGPDVGSHDLGSLGGAIPEDQAEWGKCQAFTEWSAMSSAWPDIPFRIGEKLLWLRLEDGDVLEKLRRGLPGENSLDLVFWGPAAKTAHHHLKRLYPPTAIVTYDDLAQFAKRTRVLTSLRHADLHVGNITYVPAKGRMMAIDLASLEFESPFICHARLETSIWFDYIQTLPIESTEVDKLLAFLDAPDLALNLSTPSKKLRLVVPILRILRKHAQQLARDTPLQGSEQLLMTYAIQVVIHQRRTLRQKDRTTDIWARYVEHWLQQLKTPSPKLKTDSIRNVPAAEETGSGPAWAEHAPQADVAALGQRLSGLETLVKEMRATVMGLTELRETLVTAARDLNSARTEQNHLERLVSRTNSLEEQVAQTERELHLVRTDIESSASVKTTLDHPGEVNFDFVSYWSALPQPQWPVSRTRRFFSVSLLASILYTIWMAQTWAQ